METSDQWLDVSMGSLWAAAHVIDELGGDREVLQEWSEILGENPSHLESIATSIEHLMGEGALRILAAGIAGDFTGGALLEAHPLFGEGHQGRLRDRALGRSRHRDLGSGFPTGKFNTGDSRRCPAEEKRMPRYQVSRVAILNEVWEAPDLETAIKAAQFMNDNAVTTAFIDDGSHQTDIEGGAFFVAELPLDDPDGTVKLSNALANDKLRTFIQNVVKAVDVIAWPGNAMWMIARSP